MAFNKHDVEFNKCNMHLTISSVKNIRKSYRNSVTRFLFFPETIITCLSWGFLSNTFLNVFSTDIGGFSKLTDVTLQNRNVRYFLQKLARRKSRWQSRITEHLFERYQNVMKWKWRLDSDTVCRWSQTFCCLSANCKAFGHVWNLLI